MLVDNGSQSPTEVLHSGSVVSNSSSTTIHDNASATPPNHLIEKEQHSESQSPPQAETTPATNSPGPVPNGGTIAWLQVLSGFMIFFNTWGIMNTFGIFQTYYESGALFNETSSNISWIGAIQAYCVMLGGLFSGPIYDRGYLRVLLVVGAFGVVFGHMMLSLCHTYWQVLLAQGFCVGLGGACLFVPGLAVLPAYFNTKIGLAMGVAAAGSSTGGIIYPIVFYQLINKIGFGWTVRVLGFIALATMLVPILLMRQRIKPLKARALIDWSAFTDWPFMIFVLGGTIGFVGLYTMLFYVSYYGESQGITNASLSFYLVPILNATSMFGRTVPNAFSDFTGPINIIIPGALICGILVFCMVAVGSVGAIVIVTLLFGFFSGVFISLPPVCFVMLTKDKSKIGTRIGMGFALIGFGILIGGPGGGSILGQSDTPNWTGLFIFGGACEVVSALVFFALRFYKVGFNLKVKV